jgi:hypothetical protein
MSFEQDDESSGSIKSDNLLINWIGTPSNTELPKERYQSDWLISITLHSNSERAPFESLSGYLLSRLRFSGFT